MMMSGSFNFVFHLLAFATLVASMVGLFVLDRKLQSEKDAGRQLYVGGLMKTFALFGPFNAVVLLLTGFGNMVNRYGWGGMGNMETWLKIKIVLFFILAFNGMILGSRMSKQRMMLIKARSENSAPPESESLIATLNVKFTIFFAVQTLLILVIVFLSVFGDGKHPGTF